MICERCNKSFTCKANDIAECDCKKIQLTQIEIDYIAKHFKTCLCNSCLQTIKEIVKHNN